MVLHLCGAFWGSVSCLSTDFAVNRQPALPPEPKQSLKIAS